MENKGLLGNYLEPVLSGMTPRFINPILTSRRENDMMQRLVWRSGHCSNNKLKPLGKNALRWYDSFLSCFPDPVVGILGVVQKMYGLGLGVGLRSSCLGSPSVRKPLLDTFEVRKNNPCHQCFSNFGQVSCCPKLQTPKLGSAPGHSEDSNPLIFLNRGYWRGLFRYVQKLPIPNLFLDLGPVKPIVDHAPLLAAKWATQDGLNPKA